MSTPSTAPILQVKGLSTGYDDLRVVWDVSLDVHPGRITALLGRNGSGKTTTLRGISGLNKLAAGTIHLDGQDIAGLPTALRIKRGLGYVQEGKRIFPGLTIEKNLVIGAHSQKMSRHEVNAEVDGIYELFPILKQKRGDRAGSMSGGQQQMLAIGQALMGKPKALMLDEPSGGLAPVIVGEVMERIDQLKATGLGILLVEQSVDAALEISDHVVVIDMGRMVVDQPVAGTDPERIRVALLGGSVATGGSGSTAS